MIRGPRVSLFLGRLHHLFPHLVISVPKNDFTNFFKVSEKVHFRCQEDEDSIDPLDSSRPRTSSSTTSTKSTRTIKFESPELEIFHKIYKKTSLPTTSSKSSILSKISAHFSTSSLDSKHSGVRCIDIAGYRRLRHPLQCEFNKVNQRWMFSAEIDDRTITTIVHKPNNPTYANTMRWGNKREFFVLDDGFSLVSTGKYIEGEFCSSRLTMKGKQFPCFPFIGH
jgi:hypothetical protein